MSTPYVSPSQINDGVQCLRRWAWPRLDGVKVPPHRSAAAGQHIHTILENWLQFGKPPDTDERLVIDSREYRPGLIAMNGMHHLPPPGPHNLVEREFRFGLWGGRIDHTHVRRGGVYLQPHEIDTSASDVIPLVGDHKTTGNMGFALDETELRSDPQGVIYANALFDEFPNVPYVEELWVYFGTAKPFPSKKVHIAVGRDEANYRLEPMNRLAEGLLRLRSSGLKAMDLPPSPSACENYGGCPHKARCALTPSQLMSGYYEQERRRNGNMESMEDLIKAATEKVNGVQTATVQAAPLTSQVTGPAPGLVLTPGWQVHPYDNTVEYLGTEWRKMQPATPAPALPPPLPVQPPPLPVVAAPSAPALPPPPMAAPPPPVVQPPPVVVAPAIVQPPAPAGLPPIVPLAVGPDGLPPGSINPPESVGVPDKLEPSPVTAATGAKDDLDPMTKEQLVTLAASMGLDTKRLREAGIREKIRAARAGGTVGVIGNASNGAGPTTQPTVSIDDTRELRLDRVTQIVAAMVIKGYPFEGMVASAKSIVDAIEAD